MTGKNAGEYAYLVSLAIAVLAGLVAAAGFGASSWIALLLVILGIVVGFLNISEKETTSFLVASIALLAAGMGANALGTAGTFSVLDQAIPRLGTLINAILGNIAVFVAPAAIIVAVKAIHALASRK